MQNGPLDAHKIRGVNRHHADNTMIDSSMVYVCADVWSQLSRTLLKADL